MPVLPKNRKSNTPTGKVSEASLNEKQMLGLPETYTVGPLSFPLQPPAIKDADAIEAAIYASFPDLLLFAVLGDRSGKGINITSLADTWRVFRENHYEREKAEWEAVKPDGFELAEWEASEPKKPEEITEAFLREEWHTTRKSLPFVIPKMCDAVARMLTPNSLYVWPRITVEKTEFDAEGNETGKTTETLILNGKRYLDDALRELPFPLFADLIRALLDALGGFPGDTGHRFLSDADGA